MSKGDSYGEKDPTVNLEVITVLRYLYLCSLITFSILSHRDWKHSIRVLIKSKITRMIVLDSCTKENQ